MNRNRPFSMVGRFLQALSLGVALSLATAGAAWGASAWPQVKLPPGAVSYPVGEQMSVNGVPMRMQGFVTRMPMEQLVPWFRNSLGKPLVENNVGNMLVLGRAEGDYFITVQLQKINGREGTRATVAVADVRGAYERRDENRAATERLLARLPPGSKILQQNSSMDGGRQASYVLAENGQSEIVNRDRLVARLREEGYTLEREGQGDRKVVPNLPEELMQGRTLFFKGRGKEAMAVIRTAGEGRTTIVINTVNVMEQVK